MSEDQNLNLIWAIGMLVLVGSALFSRRIGLGEIVRTALSWVAIFAIFIVAFSYKDEILSVWQRVTGELTGENDQLVVGSTLKIKQSADGHYWVNALVNGKSVRFLIDSGATITAVNMQTAKEIGAQVDENGFPTILTTANGMVEASRGKIEKLEVGPIIAMDLPIVVAEEFGNSNVIGMNFLSQMKSWRVEGKEMILEPPETNVSG